MTALDVLAFIQKCQRLHEREHTLTLATELVDIVSNERIDAIKQCGEEFRAVLTVGAGGKHS